ncbi:MAG: DbpA RNA binding domain-containing protein, partial [Mesonia sp.]
TEINHEIDSYLPQIEEIFQDFSKEEVIKKVFSVEFTRFFNYYKNASKLNSPAANHNDYREGEDSGESTRYFINVGAKDDFDWMSLKDFLKENLDLGRDGVSRVDVKDSFSFFNTDTTEKDKVLAFFENYEHDGRQINVEETKDKGGNRDRKKRGGGGFRKGGGGKRSGGGGFNKSSDSGSRGEGFSRRSGESSGKRKSNIKSSVSRRRNKK